MNLVKKMGSVALTLVLVSCGPGAKNKTMTVEEYKQVRDKKINSVADAIALFPQTVEAINQQKDLCMQLAKQELDKIYQINLADRTFDNTARAFDALGNQFSIPMAAIQAIEMVSPDAAMRKAAHEATIEMQNFSVDTFTTPELYQAFKAYTDNGGRTENLNPEQRYFLEETLADLAREGLGLPKPQLDEVKVIKKDLAQLALAYDKNIADDASHIIVQHADLEGLAEKFIENLKQEDGTYRVGCDYPTYNEVMEHCSVEETRKRVYRAFQNRAYPDNVELLEKIIAVRDTLAKKLGFPSYAAFDIDGEMAKTPERAEQFLGALAEKASRKADKELDAFAANLFDGVRLDASGKFNPWDIAYVKADYKKKNFDIDEREVAKYFEAQQTLQAVFTIYQQFLSLEFTLEKPSGAWHPDVQAITVVNKHDKALRGYIFLDLYPRANKFSHACCMPVVPTTMRNGQISPAVVVVIANFPKATKDQPALLKFQDAETFFHEFGHAMHALLGATELPSFSGTNVKRDFVEMPSQMLEEWMFNKPMLKQISKHYQTGEPLPDGLIDKLIGLKKFDSGYFVLRQCWLSYVSLELFKEGAIKNSSKVVQGLAQRLLKKVNFDPETHFQASFGHLTGYGAKYYGYQWSKVFALDIFKKIEQQGLLNPEAGQLFVSKILGKGGSVDPDIMLKDFLGREPNQEAFLQDLGML